MARSIQISTTIRRSPALLGEVAKNGAAYFYGDINDCRAYLRTFGCECLQSGWEGNGWRGMIDFSGSAGTHYAAVWRKEN